MISKTAKITRICITLLAAITACSTPIRQGQSPDGKLTVIATTTIVSDVVKQIGGDKIELTTLLPGGVDPHAFVPTPQDVTRITQADLIFANGAGLEAFLDPLLESAGAKDKVTFVSDGIQLLHANPDPNETDHPDPQPGDDPHTWTDPNNVLIWIGNIEKKLSAQDPKNAASYRENALAYTQQINDLDGWVREQVAQIPHSKRLIVTDHLLFAYFAAEYGFTQVGAIIPGYSTMAEPSAQDIAALEDTIRNLGVKAVFVGKSINPNLAERIAQDTGIHLVFIYTGSLSEPGGEADSYLAYVRYNVSAIVNALR